MKLAPIELTSITAPGDRTTAPCCIVLKRWGKGGWVTRCRNLQTNGEHGGIYFERHEFDSPAECYQAAYENYLDRCASLGVSPGPLAQERQRRDELVAAGDLQGALQAAIAIDKIRWPKS